MTNKPISRSLLARTPEDIFICDAHTDTLSKMLKHGWSSFCDIPRSSQVTAQRLMQSPVGLVVLACFTEKHDRSLPPLLRTLKMIDLAYAAVRENEGWMQMVTNKNEFKRAHQRGKLAIVLSLENAIAVEKDIGLLRIFHRLGIRMISLTWNHRNRLGDGIGKPSSKRGLTGLGRTVLGEMKRLGIMVDVSHLNERTFWDVLDQTDAPVIASHSNAYSVCPHRRNLTDAQIKAIAERKGFIGLNFCNLFLKKSGRASSEDIIKHALHIARIGGMETPAIGSDYDGISDPPAGLEHIGKTAALLRQLERAGLSKEEIMKLAHGNFLRVFASVCG